LPNEISLSLAEALAHNSLVFGQTPRVRYFEKI